MRLERAVVRPFGQEANLFQGQGVSTSFKLQEANLSHIEGVSTSFNLQGANAFHGQAVSTSFKLQEPIPSHELGVSTSFELQEIDYVLIEWLINLEKLDENTCFDLIFLVVISGT